MDQSPPPEVGLHDPVASHLGYMLRRASAVVMAGLGAGLAGIGLRPVEGTILTLVGANPGCIQSDLGRMLGIKRANMVPLIAGLAGKGLLTKSPVDGRSLALFLTATGEAARAQVDAIMAAHEARFDRLLVGQDLTVLRNALRRITQEGETAPD
ncbi:MarR family winged helix-turn-helix transcriptional regulator [Sphingobium sp. CAP-1]|uniref:MarR family winged helix-turn-helix transcriptional regulator n=1 Tax=Sphingobium sp. CAP-1 TaxID=2676077 RepID=UPI0012BB359A|nr:MarR family winged helix-turn-helix transcriptional regulator [Sphingobium sp. CAP-1]QGP81094.1 MarR family transcriptional regulator [Sphingobium sp. CAP-1]